MDTIYDSHPDTHTDRPIAITLCFTYIVNINYLHACSSAHVNSDHLKNAISRIHIISLCTCRKRGTLYTCCSPHVNLFNNCSDTVPVGHCIRVIEPIRTTIVDASNVLISGWLAQSSFSSIAAHVGLDDILSICRASLPPHIGVALVYRYRML